MWERVIYEYNKTGEFVRNKVGLRISEFVISAGCIFTVMLMFYRCLFGAALVDEAYHVSDALAMMHGNLPYVYNWFAGCGMDFLLIPLLFVYEHIVPDLEGVFLFTRICFLVFRIVLLLFAFKLIRKRLQNSYALLLIGFMIPFYGEVIFNFNYNTISIWMGFLVGILLWDALNKKADTRINYFIAGICSALAVFAHPIYVVNIIFFIGLILICQKKFPSLLWYISGGLIEILVVFVPIIIQSGFNKLLYGIRYILNSHLDAGSNLVKNTSLDRIYDAFHAFCLFWAIELAVFIFVYVFCRKVYARTGKEIEKNSKIVLAAACATSVGVVAVMVLKDFDLNACCSLGGIGSLGILLLLGTVKKENLIIYVGLPPVLFAWSEVILTGSNGSAVRFYGCILCFVSILYMCLQDSNRLVRLLGVLLSLVMTILQCYIDFNYVYQDKSFEQLAYKVESGVYKGIYTNVERVDDLPELERYLDDAINDNEVIAFRDNAPCAYLMKNQNICDVWTWDTLQYERGNKSPVKMFTYYKTRDRIPDKIIYIDFGRTEKLSIEDPDFLYNEFVKRYYILDDERQLNSTFRVKLYVNNGTFDRDYDYWINKF